MRTPHADTPPGRLNRGWTYHDRVQASDRGRTVLEFYTRRYPHSSEATWRERIQNGDIRLDGKPTAPETRLVAGQRLSYHRRPWREPDVPRNVAVLYGDEHILAADKPSGLPVLPGGNHLDNTLLAILRDRYGEAAAPIHRLGRGTSGIVLFARTPLAKRALSRDLQDGRIEKVYRALASGTDMPDRFVVNHPIGRIPYPGIGALHAAVPDGRPSRTGCRVLHRDRKNNRTLLHVDLITGRPHQIRIHLAAAGRPLVGDPLYGIGGLPVAPPDGGPLPLPGDCGYHLHAHRVRFTHPETLREISLTCPPSSILCTPEERASSPT